MGTSLLRTAPARWWRFLPRRLVSTVMPSVTLLPRILFLHPTTVMFHMNRTNYQLIDISEDGLFVSLLTESGNTKDDLGLPTYDNLLGQIKTGFGEGKDVVVTVMSAMGRSRSDFTDKGLIPVFEDRTSPTKEIEISILLMALRVVSIH
ncbi:hypothetical protein OsJ_23637 [Oryza sativa Japonica Group]|uniref:Translation initiation factor 5A C-terminal domain-containing protein n=1 Tax=Oryza sativa subsp. japonica TaxID=39947 RepID=B9FWB2_ORYSJ|nr:hypothetical protein OsJ_23637 [Oryza sativa Japonica Group]